MPRVIVFKNLRNTHHNADRHAKGPQFILPYGGWLVRQTELKLTCQFGPVCFAVVARSEPVIFGQMLTPKM